MGESPHPWMPQRSPGFLALGSSDVGRKPDDGLLFELGLVGGTLGLALGALLRFQLLALPLGLLSLALGERYLWSTQS